MTTECTNGKSLSPPLLLGVGSGRTGRVLGKTVVRPWKLGSWIIHPLIGMGRSSRLGGSVGSVRRVDRV